MKRAPRRLQRKRTAGYRMPKDAVYVGRPTKWGNPYRVVRATGGGYHIAGPSGELPARFAGQNYAVHDAVAHFEHALKDARLGVTLFDVSNELRGKDLVCWCPLPKPGELDMCHAAALLRIANSDNRMRRFAVSCEVTCEIELSQSLLDAVLTDEWRARFYKLLFPVDVAQHLAFNLLQGRSLTSLDGFADRGPGEAQVRGTDFDHFNVKYIAEGSTP